MITFFSVLAMVFLVCLVIVDRRFALEPEKPAEKPKRNFNLYNSHKASEVSKYRTLKRDLKKTSLRMKNGKRK